MTRWLFAAVPVARVAWLRTVLYLFVVVDVLLTTPWVAAHRDVPTGLYQPLLVGRLLHLPTPTHTGVIAVEVGVLVASLVAATGRLPRVAGITVALLYLEWMVIANSYGKVDHDRFAFLVALAVLPTAGRARHDDQTASEAAGWAVRAIQLSVVATYFFSAWAKLRFGGLGWVNSAVLTRAVLRRGTPLADPLLHHAWVLQLSQWGIMAFELASPIVLWLRGRWVYVAVGFFLAFHVVTFAAITISFLPHVMCLLAFLPLERIRIPVRARLLRAAPASA
ncbi:MAG: hypothetical protein QOK42_268 [Frankiaceae bacterium]|jgi:hypothetical protein|nr:hypothetical protein [Frankiaceae bacterium]